MSEEQVEFVNVINKCKQNMKEYAIKGPVKYIRGRSQRLATVAIK